LEVQAVFHIYNINNNKHEHEKKNNRGERLNNIIFPHLYLGEASPHPPTPIHWSWEAIHSGCSSSCRPAPFAGAGASPLARLALPLRVLPLPFFHVLATIRGFIVFPFGLTCSKRKGERHGIYINGVTSLFLILAFPFPSLDLCNIEI
jgi:hypothetical protein